MDEETRETLTNIIQALNALSEVIEKTITFGMADGTGDFMLKQYRGLYFRTSQILSDDAYVQEYLNLEPMPKATDEQKIVQVNLLCGQLLLYLRGLVKGGKSRTVIAIRGEEGKGKELGRDLREQIMEATRDAVKRVLSQSSIEEEPSKPEPPGDRSPRHPV